MKQKFNKHLFYYSSLISILLFGVILIFVSSPNLKLQSDIILLTIFFYIILGLLHHKINHELTAKIVIEYILIGALGASIIFFTFGGIL